MIDSEFYTKDKEIKLYKPNTLVDAGFDLTLAEFNLVNLSVNKLLVFYRKYDSLGDGKVLITAREFSYATGSSLSHAYETLKQASTSLIGKQLNFTLYMNNEGRQPGEKGEISVNKPKHNNYVTFRQPFFWVQNIEYEDNVGAILIEFSESVNYLIENSTKSFTKYHFTNALSLKTFNSRKLYELAIKWEKVGKVEMSLYDWKEFFGVQANYQEVGEFNRRVLSPAIKKVNEAKEFKLTLEPIRTTTHITHFRILIKRLSKTIQNPAKAENNTKKASKTDNVKNALKNISQNLPYKTTKSEQHTNQNPTKNAEMIDRNKKILVEMLANPKFVKEFKNLNESDEEFSNRLATLQETSQSRFFELYAFHFKNK